MRSHLLSIDKVFGKAVILNDDSDLIFFPKVSQQEVTTVSRMLVGRVQLAQIVADWKLCLQLDVLRIVLEKGSLLNPLEDLCFHRGLTRPASRMRASLKHLLKMPEG